ncbi:MAG: hypothetical protein PHO15_10920 [Eubacteriales bacterium]|nr:hypothetical protein [Eubacteriales bacterium]
MPKKDLRQMKKDKKKAKLNKEDIREAAKHANVNADIDDIDKRDIKNMEKTFSEYENKSEGELIDDLERMISEGKKDGTFSEEMLDAFIKNVAPMMDKSQRKKLEAIARMIKMNKI